MTTSFVLKCSSKYARLWLPILKGYAHERLHCAFKGEKAAIYYDCLEETTEKIIAFIEENESDLESCDMVSNYGKGLDSEEVSKRIEMAKAKRLKYKEDRQKDEDDSYRSYIPRKYWNTKNKDPVDDEPEEDRSMEISSYPYCSCKKTNDEAFCKQKDPNGRPHFIPFIDWDETFQKELQKKQQEEEELNKIILSMYQNDLNEIEPKRRIMRVIREKK